VKQKPIRLTFNADFSGQEWTDGKSSGGQNGWGGRFLTKLISHVKSLRVKEFGGIAQLVERLVRNEKVRGSNPLTSKISRQRNSSDPSGDENLVRPVGAERKG
jgi:hypothetical protein